MDAENVLFKAQENIASYGSTENDLHEFHCHSNSIDKQLSNKRARTVLWLSLFVCAAFMIVEITGGIIAQSLAIITDAAHLLTDFASILISLFSLYVANMPASQRMSFGWYRADDSYQLYDNEFRFKHIRLCIEQHFICVHKSQFTNLEVLGALISIVLIWFITGILVYFAIERILTNKYDINASVMAITAVFGVLVNIVMTVILYIGGHSHTHSRGDTKRKLLLASNPDEIKKVNINVRATMIHIIGDLIQSIGVLIASILIFFKKDWSIVDPICTLMFSIIVLCTTLYILRDAVFVLLEAKNVWTERKKVMATHFRKIAHDINKKRISSDLQEEFELSEPSSNEGLKLNKAKKPSQNYRRRKQMVKFGSIGSHELETAQRLMMMMTGRPSSIDFRSVFLSLKNINGVEKVHDLRIWSLTMDKIALSVHLEVISIDDCRRILQNAILMLRQSYNIDEVTIQIEDYNQNGRNCIYCFPPHIKNISGQLQICESI